MNAPIKIESILEDILGPAAKADRDALLNDIERLERENALLRHRVKAQDDLRKDAIDAFWTLDTRAMRKALGIDGDEK